MAKDKKDIDKMDLKDVDVWKLSVPDYVKFQRRVIEGLIKHPHPDYYNWAQHLERYECLLDFIHFAAGCFVGFFQWNKRRNGKPRFDPYMSSDREVFFEKMKKLWETVPDDYLMKLREERLVHGHPGTQADRLLPDHRVAWHQFVVPFCLSYVTAMYT